MKVIYHPRYEEVYTSDYKTIGEMVKDFAVRACTGRSYGVLEGGYNHDVLGVNIKALLEGMR